MLDSIRGPRNVLRTLVVPTILCASWFHFNRVATITKPAGEMFSAVGLWALMVVLGVALARVHRRGSLASGACLGLVMALARVFGAHFQPDKDHPFTAFGHAWPLELLVDWAVLGATAAVVVDLLRGSRHVSGAPVARRWLVLFPVAMLVCWLPWLLFYYPGIVVRDSWSSMFMGLGLWPMGNHHPVVFTLWVGACLHLAQALGMGLTAGVLVFSVTQMLVMAAGLALVVAWVGRRAGNVAGWCALAFFCLSPQVGMWSVTMHKDSLFVVWMTLLAVLLAEVHARGLRWLARPRPLAAFVVLLLLVSFSRNNGPHVAAGIVGVLLLMTLWDLRRARRDRGWRVPVAGLAALATVFIVQGPVYRAAHVVPSEYAESVGLPLQQVAWAVKFGTTTAAQRAEVAKFMPVATMRQKYTPTISDNVKLDPSFHRAWLNDHHDEFLSLWRSLAGSNAAGYTKAWYALAGRYLDVDSFFTRFDPGTKAGSGELVVLDRNLLRGVTGDLPAASLTRLTGHVASAAPVSLAFTMPIVFWACVLAAVAALLERRARGALPYLPFVLAVATLLIAAPVTDFRYVAAGHFMLPVLLVCLWRGPRVGADHGEEVVAPAPSAPHPPALVEPGVVDETGVTRA